MAGRIPQSFIDDLLTRVDVIDVVDSRVKLKKTGKNYSACCPFHNEKSPSFTVSPDKQFYYCFGCGASGSALKFVMEFDGVSFPEAVEKLAQQAGMEVPKEQASAGEIRQEELHKPLLELMEKAGRFYEQMLRSHEQRGKAVDYLKGRGLSGKAAKFFGIGFAPPGWDNLQSFLAANGDKNTIKQLISCGMLIEKEDGRTYDRFRDRIMFPIRDARGRYIGFGGRVLTDEKPKYLNSPETPLFHKGKELYGLYEARKIRQKLTRFVIVEGYMDVVALAEYGIHYAVATLGTATSEHHLRRLFKIVPEVIFCFDGDNAGRTAAARAMETVLPVLEDGLQARFLFLPDGEDPDSLVRKEGKPAFEQRLNNAVHLPEFLFSFVKEQVDFDTLDGKARFDQLAAPLINRLPKGMLRNLMRKQLGDELGTDSVALEKLENAPETAPPTIPPATHQANHPAASDEFAAAAVPDYLHEDPDEQLPPVQDHSADTLAPLVYKALCAIVRKPVLANQLTLPATEAESEQERLLLEVLKKLQQSPQSSSIGLLIQWIGSPYQSELQRIAELPKHDIPPAASDIEAVLKQMNARQLSAELRHLTQRFERGEKLSPEERARKLELQKQLHHIHKKRARIYNHNPH
ncbi:DNA primase [Venatoribacter cucullus]|uniref:DNA primase n=1 Tax=Venatoribacter cucullus TaxID=2661630 RepID=A0A9X7UXN6_9GAMM|nr:DNA primase [Venatoribacter cucullus]QQD24937.1 DNA primase [Venatoribacter cucullus]